MTRLFAALLLCAFALAPAASADVRPLADRDFMGVPALDGGSVVYVQPRRASLGVFEQPLAGGAATELARVTEGGFGRAEWDLAAGPAGMALRMHATAGRPQLLAGPRQGPLAVLQRRASQAAPDVEQRDLFSVPGGPLVLERTNRSGTRLRAVLRPPGGAATVLDMPAGADLHNLAVAGSVAAVWTPREVVLLDLPSGAVRSRLPLGRFARAPLLSLGVSPAGDVALIVEDGGADVVGWAPAGATEPRILIVGDQFDHVRTAGGLIAMKAPAVGGDAGRVVVLDPAADPPRELFRGPPAAAVRGIDFDGSNVAWATDGCQLVADIGSPALGVIPAGPCVRSEASFTQFVPSSVRYRIRCITAPGRRCRIDIRVQGSRLQRLARKVVTIPRGRARIVRVPVRTSDDIFVTTARVIDPDGRRRVAITF